MANQSSTGGATDAIAWPPDTTVFRRALRRLFLRKIRLIVPTISSNSVQALDALLPERDKLTEPKLDVLFDFSQCRDLSPQAIAYLGGLARLVLRSRGVATFDWDTCRPRVLKELQDSGFPAWFSGPSGVPDPHAIPYREDDGGDPSKVFRYLSEAWLGQDWILITPALREALVLIVLEIYLNAFEHGHSPVGVITCGQHQVEKRRLRLTVMDFGVGIPSNVRRFTSRPALRASTAMKWAFEQGTTTNPVGGRPRGMGLDLLKEFVRLNHGALTVLSHDGIASFKGGTPPRFINRQLPFRGTLVDIVLRCDETYYALASEMRDRPPLFSGATSDTKTR